MQLSYPQVNSVHSAVPIADVLFPNHQCTVLSIGYSNAPLPQHVILILVSVQLYHLITFSFKFLSDRNLFSEFGLSCFIFLKDVAVSDCIEALFDETLSPNSL